MRYYRQKKFPFLSIKAALQKRFANSTLPPKPAPIRLTKQRNAIYTHNIFARIV
jgi:hypothetical protein